MGAQYRRSHTDTVLIPSAAFQLSLALYNFMFRLRFLILAVYQMFHVLNGRSIGRVRAWPRRRPPSSTTDERRRPGRRQPFPEACNFCHPKTASRCHQPHQTSGFHQYDREFFSNSALSAFQIGRGKLLARAETSSPSSCSLLQKPTIPAADPRRSLFRTVAALTGP